MSVSVADRSANRDENVVNAAAVIGKSAHRRKVFEAIYTGKKKEKSVKDLMKATGLNQHRVLDAGLKLYSADIIGRVKVGSETKYTKIAWFQPLRNRILALASDEKKRNKVPTKSRPASQSTVNVTVKARIKQNRIQAKQITIDDIDSFSKVRAIPHGLEFVKMPETRFKNGVASILGERGSFKDWGGESRDLSSSHVRIGGERKMTAMAFKGPGTSGVLTPKKMGHNGDQIQRLSRCPAVVFLVQYWGSIDDSVLNDLKTYVELRSFYNGKLNYGIIDGDDSARLITAYPTHFGIKGRKKAKKAKKR